LFARFENAAAEAGVEIAQQQSFQNPMFSLAGVSEYLRLNYYMICVPLLFLI